MEVRVQSHLNRDLVPVRANRTIRCFSGLVLLTFKEGFWQNLVYTSLILSFLAVARPLPCSIGLRSEDWLGQTRFILSFDFSHLVLALVLFSDLSCFETHVLP